MLSITVTGAEAATFVIVVSDLFIWWALSLDSNIHIFFDVKLGLVCEVIIAEHILFGWSYCLIIQVKSDADVKIHPILPELRMNGTPDAAHHDSLRAGTGFWFYLFYFILFIQIHHQQAVSPTDR